MECEKNPIAFDASTLQHQSNIPKEFVWSEDETACQGAPMLDVPPIDLGGFLVGDPTAMANATRIIDKVCREHGFFVVENHGIDMKLVEEVHKGMEFFFSLPLEEKRKAWRKNGDPRGYASSFVGRFTSKLPWKETLSFQYVEGRGEFKDLVSYIVELMGEEYTQFGELVQRYSEAMNTLALNIMELLGTSLSVGPTYFKEFFKENDSIMRLNYYPLCQRPELALGTGPHRDPVSLTILHQDAVGGLEVFTDGKWYSIPANPDAFVLNIGDTFAALSNGIYKSCVHRALVNTRVARKSIAFFLSPNVNKIVRPPKELVSEENPRTFPDFTWKDLLDFTLNHYRSDFKTLEAFVKWIQQKNSLDHSSDHSVEEDKKRLMGKIG